MEIQDFGLDVDEFEALMELEEEELLRNQSNNDNEPLVSISIEPTSTSHSKNFNSESSSSTNLPTSISDTLLNLGSSSASESGLVNLLKNHAYESSSKRKPRGRGPPASLQEHASRKGSLSVSDLIGPIYCEYQYQYGILGQAHLRLSNPERPTKIITPAGNTIVPDPIRAEQKEKVMDRGTKVHKKLEREVAPRKVYVKTKTREDDWGLRLIRLVGSIKSILKGGISREVPVFGILDGKMIYGVIDEISVASLLPPKEIKNKNEGKDISNLNGPSKSPKKSWTSQEEWKKEKDREKVLGKKGGVREKGQPALSFSKSVLSSSSSKSKEVSSNNASSNSSIPEKPSPSVPSSQSPKKNGPLDKFFSPKDGGGSSNSNLEEDDPPENSTESKGKAKEKAKEDEPIPNPACFGFHLSDSKTRASPKLPFPEDQKGPRRQCMVYKRLFDGLSFGAILQSSNTRRSKAYSTASLIAKTHYPATQDISLNLSVSSKDPTRQPAPKPSWLSIDPNSDPLLLYEIFEMLNLDPEKDLSHGFVEDSRELWEEWGVVVGREREVEVEDEDEDEVEEVGDRSLEMTETENEVGEAGKSSNTGDVEMGGHSTSTTIATSSLQDPTEEPQASSSKPIKKKTKKVLTFTLNDLALLLEDTLLEFSALSEIGASGIIPENSDSNEKSNQDWKPKFQGASIQNELRLVYRLRENRGNFNRLSRGRRGNRNDDDGTSDLKGKRKREDFPQAEKGGSDCLDEEAQMALAIQMSLEQVEKDGVGKVGLPSEEGVDKGIGGSGSGSTILLAGNQEATEMIQVHRGYGRRGRGRGMENRFYDRRGGGFSKGKRRYQVEKEPQVDETPRESNLIFDLRSRGRGKFPRGMLHRQNGGAGDLEEMIERNLATEMPPTVIQEKTLDEIEEEDQLDLSIQMSLGPLDTEDLNGVKGVEAGEAVDSNGLLTISELPETTSASQHQEPLIQIAEDVKIGNGPQDGKMEVDIEEVGESSARRSSRLAAKDSGFSANQEEIATPAPSSVIPASSSPNLDLQSTAAETTASSTSTQESQAQTSTPSPAIPNTLSPTKPASRSISPSRLSPFSSPEAALDPLLLGIVCFPHNPSILEAHLQSILKLWTGNREPQGVSESEVARCGWCEYREGCEWRIDKGKARVEKAEAAKRERTKQRLEKELEESKQRTFEELKGKKGGLSEVDLWESIDDQEVDWGALEL